jgi:hypothetical protein
LAILSLVDCVDDGPMAPGQGETGSVSTETGTPADVPTSDCSLDIYDPNDSLAASFPIEPNAIIVATVCTSLDDVDWWSFMLDETSYVGTEVLFSKDSQDLRLELWNAETGMMIAHAQDGADIQALHELLEPGSYAILVERRDGDPTYTLETYALSTATPPSPQGGATRVFCPRFDLDLDFSDAAEQAGLREDFGVEDAHDRWRPESMLVQVLDAGGNVARGWGPLDSDGCTPPVWTPSPNDTQFVLQYALWSHFVRDPLPDTFTIVYDCENMQPCALRRPYVGWETAAGIEVEETRFIGSADAGEQFREELLVYWASAFAESRLTMGIDAHIYARLLGSADLGGGEFLACPTGHCPNGTTCEFRVEVGFHHCRPKTRGTTNVGGHPTLDIAASAVDGAAKSEAPESKFTIVHELGHLQTLWVPGFDTMMSSANYDWCFAAGIPGENHTLDSPEWQSAALVEGFANFYATAVFNNLEGGAWYHYEDVETDTMRFQAQCQDSLDSLMCALPGDATACMDAGASNEIDWAGSLWDFAKIVGEPALPDVLALLSEAGQLNWDPGSTTPTAYNNILQAASLRFPKNGSDFDAAAQANGTNR